MTEEAAKSAGIDPGRDDTERGDSDRGGSEQDDAAAAKDARPKDTPPKGIKWCVGLRHAGRRRLTLGEFAELRRKLRKLRTQVVASIAGLLLLPGALWLLGHAAASDAVPPSMQMVLLLVCVATLALGLPILLLLARDLRKRARRLTTDLLAGHVEHFKGVIERPNTLDAAQRRLLRARLLERDSSEVQWLEVLPTCERVLAVNGQILATWVQAPICFVSIAPEPAAEMAFEADPVLIAKDPNMLLRRRSLTKEEMLELRRYVRRWRIPSGWTFCCLLVLVLIALEWHRNEMGFVAWVQQYSVQLACVVVGVLLGCLYYVRDVLFARDIHRDQQMGYLVAVHPRNERGAMPPSDDPPLRELLPVSRCLWSEQGVPAPWRLVRW